MGKSEEPYTVDTDLKALRGIYVDAYFALMSN